MIGAKSARSNESNQADQQGNDERGDHDRVVDPFFNSLLGQIALHSSFWTGTDQVDGGS